MKQLATWDNTLLVPISVRVGICFQECRNRLTIQKNSDEFSDMRKLIHFGAPPTNKAILLFYYEASISLLFYKSVYYTI